MRQRLLHHKFQAHDSAVKCLSLDPHEEFFISGSADGDIKVFEARNSKSETKKTSIDIQLELHIGGSNQEISKLGVWGLTRSDFSGVESSRLRIATHVQRRTFEEQPVPQYGFRSHKSLRR